MNKPTVLIYDLDGVVIDSSIRLKKYLNIKALEQNDYWSYARSLLVYSKTVEDDKPIEAGIKFINSFPADRKVAITARGEFSRELTESFLQPYLNFPINKSNLIMRPELFTDIEGTEILDREARFLHVPFKKEIALNLSRYNEVVLAIDDNIDICEMYRALSFPTIHFMVPGVEILQLTGENKIESTKELICSK